MVDLALFRAWATNILKKGSPYVSALVPACWVCGSSKQGRLWGQLGAPVGPRHGKGAFFRHIRAVLLRLTPRLGGQEQASTRRGSSFTAEIVGKLKLTSLWDTQYDPLPSRFIPETQKSFLSSSRTDTHGVLRSRLLRGGMQGLDPAQDLSGPKGSSTVRQAPESSDTGNLLPSRPTPPALASGIWTNLHPVGFWRHERRGWSSSSPRPPAPDAFPCQRECTGIA